MGSDLSYYGELKNNVRNMSFVCVIITCNVYYAFRVMARSSDKLLLFSFLNSSMKSINYSAHAKFGSVKEVAVHLTTDL